MQPARRLLRVRDACHIALFLLAALQHRAFAQQNPDGKFDPTTWEQPLVLMARDPAVHQLLRLSPPQRRTLQANNDVLDGVLWTTRNQPTDKSRELTANVVSRTRDLLAKELTPAQLSRLDEIELQCLGYRSLLTDRLVSRLKLTESQRTQIEEALAGFESGRTALQKRLQQGEDAAALTKENRSLQATTEQRLLDILQPEQRRQWVDLLGERVDLKTLGSVKFRAPDFIPTEENVWINGPPLSLPNARGSVVVVHVFAFGCINCIHNYPAYKSWMQEFEGQDFHLVGIHTPETRREHDIEQLKAKLRENDLHFPVLIDNDLQNWNAWGNNLWPSVYVIDKNGYVRAWWLGELNWKDSGGQELLRRKIQTLLRENPVKSP